MMDSSIEISSSSDYDEICSSSEYDEISSSSDDEVPEPVIQETKTMKNPGRLRGSRSFAQRSSSAENSEAKTVHTTHASRESKAFTRNENIVVDSRKSNVSSQQAQKRALSPSFGLPPFPCTSPHGVDSGNMSRFGGAGNKSTFGDRYRGTSGSPLRYAGASDHVHRSGIGEHRNSENDERLIYQAALQDLNQPKTEMDLPPDTLSVPLMRHQKIALAWMYQKETRSLHCSGGILADDQGLGKTISTIALILKQKLESQLMSEMSSCQEAEIVDLDADDDESENSKHESESHVNCETTVLNADEKESSEIEKVKDEEASTSTRELNRKRPAAGTLIVCPASVVKQWARELDEKVSDKSKLSVLVYHGGNRTKDPIELAKYDVVVTTYAIVNSEVPKQPLVDEEDENDEKNKKRKVVAGVSKKSKKRGKKSDDSSFEPDCGTLARVGWLRVVLDEAQTIKNHKTQVARACCTLRAKKRWCLSGTPIQNMVDDLYSYFRFLRYHPYAVYKSFNHTIKAPISKNPPHGYKKLQVVLRAVMLRRTKGTLLDGEPIIELPPKKINLRKVDFSAEERSFYVKLEADSRSQFKAYAAAGTLKQNYANILQMLLRLRQACDHPQLVKDYNSDPVGKVSVEAVKRLPREAQINMLNRLESTSVTCSDCDDTPVNPVVTFCGHVFCYQCVSKYITRDGNMCPVRRCREDLARDVVFSESALRNCIKDDLGCSSSRDEGLDTSVLLNSEFVSSKIKAVLDILESHSKQGSPNNAHHGQMPSSSESDDDDDVTNVEPTSHYSSSPSQGPIKTIVFSQWIGMLNLVEMCFVENDIDFRRLDGTMSLAARDEAVKEFCSDPDAKVMLMSLKAGNLGLNMVAACHVIILDLWWNPTTEDQAIDRAHRIGQTRTVTVTRITIKDTIEDRILLLQEDKRKMIASAFGEEHGGSTTRLTEADLNYLFQV